MNRKAAFISAALSLILAGCGFAKYSKLRVQVVDERTMAGIPEARLRAFYIKPMLDPTYQWKDRETSDRKGFATLTIATNHSQWFILGPTHGIFPNISVEAEGYLDKRLSVPHEAFQEPTPFLIQMTRE